MNLIAKTTSVVATAVAATILVSTPASAATPTWSNNDRQFVRAVRGEAPVFYDIPAREMIKSAKLACKVLRVGAGDVFYLIDTLVEAGFEQDESIALIAGAVVFYCPEQQRSV